MAEDLTLLRQNPFSFLEREEVAKLPIPSLEETLQRYLTQVEPLLTPDHFTKTKQFVSEFLKTEGPILDKELHALAAESPTSWLEGIWDTGYLECRVPLPINISPFFVIHPTPNMKQLRRAADIISSAVRLWETIKAGNLPLEKVRGKVQCMTSYWRIFGTCRIPKPSRDELFTCPTSKHIVVVSNSRYYSLYVYDSNGIPSSPETIEKSLEKIQKHSQNIQNDDGSNEGGIGLWTCENRDSWSSTRQSFLELSGNEENLHIIDSGIFVVCLDDEAFDDVNAESRNMLHGSCGVNRWFDKLQLIVCKNGSAAFNLEHSPHDGHTLLICTTFIYDEILGNKLIPGSQEKSTLVSSNSFQYLPWNLTHELKESLRVAKATFKTFTEQTQTSVLIFTDFGATEIKKLKMSPDAFVQMAYQLAYFRITGNVQSTYESCNTKGFYHGRTETIRSVSKESKLMCEKYFLGATPPSEKEALIRAAVARHIKTGRAAKVGNGVDRHLAGLKTLARHKQVLLPLYEIPAIFRDPAYSKFCGSILSTSNCGGYAFDLFGFGPVMPTGLGIGYNIKRDQILFNITSFINQAETFSTSLRNVLLDMRALCSSQLQSNL